MKDYYYVMGLNHTAEPEVIKAAYRALCTLYHPDKNPGIDEKFMQSINEAYDVLSDDQRRRAYNVMYDLDQNRVPDEQVQHEPEPDLEHLYPITFWQKEVLGWNNVFDTARFLLIRAFIIFTIVAVYNYYHPIGI